MCELYGVVVVVVGVVELVVVDWVGGLGVFGVECGVELLVYCVEVDEG